MEKKWPEIVKVFKQTKQIDKNNMCENKIKQNDEKSVWKMIFLNKDYKITKKGF